MSKHEPAIATMIQLVHFLRIMKLSLTLGPDDSQSNDTTLVRLSSNANKGPSAIRALILNPNPSLNPRVSSIGSDILYSPANPSSLSTLISRKYAAGRVSAKPNAALNGGFRICVRILKYLNIYAIAGNGETPSAAFFCLLTLDNMASNRGSILLRPFVLIMKFHKGSNFFHPPA
jgi:hypothetical protein